MWWGNTNLFDFARERRLFRQATRAATCEVDVGEARVFVDHGFQWDGNENVWLTRARAAYVLGFGPVFELKPRALLARLTGICGGVSSGDPCFDDFFSLKSAAPEHAWNALTTRVRSLLAGSFEDARVISDGHMVSLWREGEFGLESDADAAVEAVLEIVSYQAHILQTLRRLHGATRLNAQGPWHDRKAGGASLSLPSPVTLHAAPGHPTIGAVVSVSAKCGRSTPRFELYVDEAGRVNGDIRRLAALDCESSSASDSSGHYLQSLLASEGLHGLGACDIICDKRQVTLTWRRLHLHSKVLTFGARLVAFLSRPAVPMYR